MSHFGCEINTTDLFFFFKKLHLSFSLSSGGEDGLKEQRDTELIPVQSLNLLLKSIGATLTDVQDVVFKYEHTQGRKCTLTSHTVAFIYFCVISFWTKPCYLADFLIYFRLAFFELNFQFCTTQQLQSEVIRHYSKQVTHFHK